MSKERWEFLLHSWIDETLTQNEQVEFEEYIRDYPERRQEARALKSTVMYLKDTPEVDVPAGFRENVMSRIQAADVSDTKVTPMKSTRRPRFITQHSMLAAAAAVLLVFVSLASIFPQVIPGLTRMLPPAFQATGDETGEDAWIAGADDDRAVDPGDSNGRIPDEERVYYTDFASFESVGYGKMDSFPRLGPNMPVVDIIHAESSHQTPQMQVPYRWASFQVRDLDEALELVRNIVQQQGGTLENVTGFRVGSEPVRINLTASIPVSDYSAAMQSLNRVGRVFDTEEALFDRGQEYAAVSELIDQLKFDILDQERKSEDVTDPDEKEMHEHNLMNMRDSLTVWEQSRARLTQGVAEISLVLER